MEMTDVYHIEAIEVTHDRAIDGAYQQAQDDLCKLIMEEMGKKFYMPGKKLVICTAYELSIGGYYRIPSSRVGVANLWLSCMVHKACERTGFVMDRTGFVIFDGEFDMIEGAME